MQFIKIVLAGAMLLASPFIHAQKRQVPVVGKPCPEFTLADVTHYSQSTLSLHQMKGKWVVLEFWSTSCSVCIKGFPKMSQMQEEFKDEAMFIVVGTGNDVTKDKQFYEKFRARYNLGMPAAYDVNLFKEWEAYAVPYIVVINPQGIVTALPGFTQLTTENVLLWMKSSIPIAGGKESDANKTTTVDHNAHQQVSVFDRWYPDQPIAIVGNLQQASATGRYKTTATALNKLYNIAYFGVTDWSMNDPLYGAVARYPLNETNDSSLFDMNFDTGLGFYSYSVTIPPGSASMENLMWAMQCDLHKYFALDASIQAREMVVWELIVSDRVRLDSLFIHPALEPDHIGNDGIKLSNKPVDRLLASIQSAHLDKYPFVNATGILENITINLDAIVSEWDDLRRVLNNYGLDIRPGKRMMKALVIH